LRAGELEQKLRLQFKDRQLLEQALTHPSYLNEVGSGDGPKWSYERLEFLGDAMLGAAITLELFKRCPDLPEGELTKLRSFVVRGRTLAKVASGLELGQYLDMGKGEDSTGGRTRESNLAAAFEALVGAVCLDRGFAKAREFVLGVMGKEIDGLLEEQVSEDSKSLLQEVWQRLGGEPPQYHLLETRGPEHAKSFDVEVLLDGMVMGNGGGQRKVDAEREAAEEALRRLKANAGR
jgi:ribonuclease-3